MEPTEYTAYIKPPYDISIRDPEGLDKDRGAHQLVIGRGNLDNVFLLSDAELEQLFQVVAVRRHQTTPASVPQERPEHRACRRQS